MNGIKRLLNSYKFYGTILGTITGFIGTKLEVENSVLLVIVGLWVTLIAGQALKDYAIERNGKK